ncbi:MAG TPA: DUF3999 family protein [Pyrinomonadaceae bacterium]|nr:DUF3999 family protein [Pyrinomonadaceae bacterium]
MKRLFAISALSFIASGIATVVAVGDSAMSAWPFVAEVTPTASPAGLYQFVVPLQVMDKALEDLADLRLYDAASREIPYALRVRREVDDAREIGGRLFNQAVVGANASEVSVDLGENPGEHNEVEIETAGTNFRRLATVEGSDTGANWKTLKTGDVIFSFSSVNSTARSPRVSYPTSRYRYLRVRVTADERVDREPPVITGVKVSMATREKGQDVTWNVSVPSYQLLRHQGAPASSWTIDLGGKVPCDRLLLTTEDQSFSRPFQVEVVDDPQNVRVVASGELTKRVGNNDQVLTITFDNEEHARKLRLLITDYSNPTLPISSIKAAAPARELYFELKEPAAQPLRLFFGNMHADAPHYDFEKELAAKLKTPALPATVGSFVKNTDYRAPLLPFTERLPWLIYVVLAISSVALVLILLGLARATMGMDRKETKQSEPQRPN